MKFVFVICTWILFFLCNNNNSNNNMLSWVWFELATCADLHVNTDDHIRFTTASTLAHIHLHTRTHIHAHAHCTYLIRHIHMGIELMTCQNWFIYICDCRFAPLNDNKLRWLTLFKCCISIILLLFANL